MCPDRPAFDAELSYLQAVQAEAVRAAHLAQRLFLWKALITVATLALAAGVISTDQQLELSGLHFKLDLWVLLVTGSVLAFLILVLDFAQYERAHRLGWRAAELYAQIGYPLPREELLLDFPRFAGHGWACGIYSLILFSLGERASREAARLAPDLMRVPFS
jgi:hypothetical protein